MIGGNNSGESGYSNEETLSEMLGSSVETFKSIRLTVRRLNSEDLVSTTPEIKDLLRCEAWGISQSQLEELTEEEINLREMVSRARMLEQGGKA